MPLQKSDRAAQDIELFQKYKQSGSSSDMEAILGNMEGLMFKEVGIYASNRHIPKSAIYAEAEQLAAEAVNTYDPEKGASLATWVKGRLRRLYDFSAKHGQLGSISKNRFGRLADYSFEKENLTAELGREPTGAEIADKLALPVAEIERIERDSAGRNLIESLSPFDDSSAHNPRRQMALQMAYYDLNNQQRLVMEYVFGMNGKPKISSNGKIARLLGIADSTVSKIKNVIDNKVNQYK